MNNKAFGFGPLALTNTYTTNILNPPTASGGVNAGSSAQYIILRRMRIINKTVNSATYRLFIGATGANTAGTEFMGYDMVVAANSFIEWFGAKRLDSSQFLVGGASASTTLTIEGDGEIGVSG